MLINMYLNDIYLHIIGIIIYLNYQINKTIYLDYDVKRFLR